MQKFNEDTKVNIYSNKGMQQDGNTYLENTLDIRDITMQVIIAGNSQVELISYRKQMQEVFNPKNGEGYLIYKDNLKEHKIKCIINKIPTLGSTTGVTQTFLISLTANNPYWTDLLESKEEIALWKGDFEFDLEITEAGIEMEHREPSLIVNVLNEGDVECGMRIEFKALATLTNPSLLNVNTGEFIKVNKGMVAGEVISVSTYFGGKKITSILNGVTTNAINCIDFQSTFLQLATGDNLMRYDATTGVDNLEVSIYYQSTYLGV